MVMPSLLSFALFFLVISHCCFARQQQEGEFRGERGRSPCQLNSLKALEPNNRVKSEAGVTDVWDDNNQQLQCAGVTVVRHNIEPRGLLLPSYTNAPQLIYIVQGRGIQGTLIPGCPETYESTDESQQGQGQGQRYRDQHQKVRSFREGDVLALPAGVAQWVYNSGDNRLVAVVLLDTSNDANQLDQNPRRFYLAGNPDREHQQEGQEKREDYRNVLSGFDTRLLAEAFGVSTETARKLQSQEDNRGNIVKVEEGLQVVRPPRMREEQAEREREKEQQGAGRRNGVEETLCSMRLGENLDEPSRADVYNPQAGRVSSLNSLNLPVLGYLRLSAERGVLYRNAILAPHYNLNAHSVTYVTRGRARVQVVDNSGRTVFNEELRQGQVLVLPQNFVVVKQASNEGFEYVSFKTNDNAMIAPLAGRTSVIRALPEEVVANAYQISREEARRLKYSRKETTVLTSRGERKASA